MTADAASSPNHEGADRSARQSGSMSCQSVGPAIVLAMLSALAKMALVNRRHEADVAMCLHRAHLVLQPGQCERALLQLLAAEWIKRIIPLADGGILVKVTEEGMRRSGRAS